MSDQFDDASAPTMAMARGKLPLLPVDDDLAPYLVVVEGGRPGRCLPIDSTPRTVGRDAARDLVLDDGQVSRVHFRILFHQNQVLLEDSQSTNGTFVNGSRVSGLVALTERCVVQAGHHVLKLERRSRKEVSEREALDRDLEKAGRYIRSLLPEPITDGAIRTDWHFHPSSQLGGDALGYHYIDEHTFACYLIDVSGHGAGAALHSVGVINLLRQRALPGVDIRQPAEVLSALNDRFQMDQHAGMLFTMWFGVFDLVTRKLRFGCAGHHPAYLIPADRSQMIPLATRGLMLGAMPDVPYRADEIDIPPAASLYLFSDGVFEYVTHDGRQARLDDLLPILIDAPARAEASRIYQAVTTAARPGPLEDDFSALVVTFL